MVSSTDSPETQSGPSTLDAPIIKDLQPLKKKASPSPLDATAGDAAKDETIHDHMDNGAPEIGTAEQPVPPLNDRPKLGTVGQEVSRLVARIIRIVHDCIEGISPAKIISRLALCLIAMSVLPLIHVLANSVAIEGASTTASAERLLKTMIPLGIVIGGLGFFLGQRIRTMATNTLHRLWWHTRIGIWKLRSVASNVYKPLAPADKAPRQTPKVITKEEWHSNPIVTIILVVIGFSLLFAGFAIEEHCRVRTFAEDSGGAHRELFAPIYMPGPVDKYAELFINDRYKYDKELMSLMDHRQVLAIEGDLDLEELLDLTMFGSIITAVVLIMLLNTLGVFFVAIGLRGRGFGGNVADLDDNLESLIDPDLTREFVRLLEDRANQSYASAQTPAIRST